ncbi:MAG: AraC family transcriptional regulator ligand-binding domain-containing protein, partial [Zavarzinia sp.]|nr:AraC family transcriptional regulator ligand-binding domain-containing protein [Zavarzinia sp.]
MSTETLPLAANYLRQIAEQIAACGIDPARWLASAGLTPAEFADPAREVSLPQFVRLVHEGLAATGEPALGLLVGERLAATTHGMLGYAALNSETLRQALDLVQLYLLVRTSLVAIRHEEWGDRMRMIFE